MRRGRQGGGHCRGGETGRGEETEWGMVGGRPFLFYIPSALSLPSETPSSLPQSLTLFSPPHALLYPLHTTVARLITHADTDFRVENWWCRCHSSFLCLPLPHFMVSPPFRQAGDTVLSASLTDRSQPLSIINLQTIYVFALCVCVCVCVQEGELHLEGFQST